MSCGGLKFEAPHKILLNYCGKMQNMLNLMLWWNKLCVYELVQGFFDFIKIGVDCLSPCNLSPHFQQRGNNGALHLSSVVSAAAIYKSCLDAIIVNWLRILITEDIRSKIFPTANNKVHDMALTAPAEQCLTSTRNDVDILVLHSTRQNCSSVAMWFSNTYPHFLCTMHALISCYSK